jgi:nitroimidazol reductase NimA-like FMN-containing flavoprotein (pyridoxamine 5'-phosphate oxidase superfamily)
MATFIPTDFIPTERTRIHRRPGRAEYNREQVFSILDEGNICHIGFAIDGQPYVIPTGYARLADELFIHGSAASRMLRAMGEGIDVCVTVTIVDGIVLARSASHHSMNYRSVVILGRARVVSDPVEKLMALRCFTNHIVPRRWEEVRPPTEQELRSTSVLALPLEEVSAKVRTGPPNDDDADLGLAVWAGVVPIHNTFGVPVPAPGLFPDTPAIDLDRFRRKNG